MLRNLQALEIAEGALMADIAVAFQFLAAFLPIGSSLFSILNFTVFTILVLRRGVYVAVMSMCVAIFLLCIMIGPHTLFTMTAEGLGGIFLGFTMKQRFHHIPVVFIGAVAGSLYIYVFTLGVAWLTGVPFQVYINGIHRAYEAALPVFALVAQRLGFGSLWQRSMYPQIVAGSVWLFLYWWVAFYCLLFVVFVPIVSTVYAVANSFVRMLGYDVRPLVEGRLGHWLHRMRRRLRKLRLKRKMERKRWNKA